MTPNPTDRSPLPPDQHLAVAYRRADYRVNGLLLKIGHPHPDFDRYLAELGHTDFVILTAYNPRSTPLPQPVNAARHRTLLLLVNHLDLDHVPASGSDPGGDWPTEHGLCLFVDAALGIHLGNFYAQHAIVVGSLGTLPRLVWL